MGSSMLEIEELSNDTPAEIEDPIQRLQRGKEASASTDDAQLIKPQAGFVVKTADTTGRKVFINVCAASEVSAPGEWADGKVPEATAKALQELEAVEGSLSSEGNEALRFPICLGELREDADHTGAVCYVTDVIFNFDVVRQAAHDRRLKGFLIQLILGYVAQKHNLVMESALYKLPRMRYKGTVGPLPQYIRKESKPLITEVKGEPADSASEFAFKFDKAQKCGKARPLAATMPAEQKAAAAVLQQAEQRAPAAAVASSPTAPAAQAAPGLEHRLEFEGCPAMAAIVTVRAPAVGAFGAADVSVSATADTLDVRVRHQTVQVKLPFSVDSSASEGVLDPQRGQLRVTLPFRPYSELLQAGQKVTAH